MRILMTGVSSFTGVWFARALAKHGHQVVGTVTRQSLGAYSPLHQLRLRRAMEAGVQVEFGAPFGSAQFLALLSRSPWDTLCHHGAWVSDHKDSAYDVLAAVMSNTLEAGQVLARFADAGGRRFLLTGTYFEADEGNGAEPCNAVSPYGLAKTITWETFRYRCHDAKVPMAKYTLPNPVGALDHRGLLPYLLREWRAGKVAVLHTPNLVRDFVPVNALAADYARFTAEARLSDLREIRRDPSGWVETIELFARRAASCVAPLLGQPCDIVASSPANDTGSAVLPEPAFRANRQSILPGWAACEQEQFWRQLVADERVVGL